MSEPTSRAAAPDPLRAMAGAILQRGLNRLLKLDPATQQRVAAMEGRALSVTFDGTSLALRIHVDEGRLQVGPVRPAAGNEDLQVGMSPGGVIGLIAARLGDQPLPPGRVRISGDAGLARELEQLMARFQPDTDEIFARLFGDVIGHQLARTFGDALRWTRDGARALGEDLVSHVRDDRRDVVAAAEMEAFCDEVDDLRERSDRLAARVARLQLERTGS